MFVSEKSFWGHWEKSMTSSLKCLLVLKAKVSRAVWRTNLFCSDVIWSDFCVSAGIICTWEFCTSATLHTEANGYNLSQWLGACVMEWECKRPEHRQRAQPCLHKEMMQWSSRHSESINWRNDWKGSSSELSFMNVLYRVGAQEVGYAREKRKSCEVSKRKTKVWEEVGVFNKYDMDRSGRVGLDTLAWERKVARERNICGHFWNTSVPFSIFFSHHSSCWLFMFWHSTFSNIYQKSQWGKVAEENKSSESLFYLKWRAAVWNPRPFTAHPLILDATELSCTLTHHICTLNQADDHLRKAHARGCKHLPGRDYSTTYLINGADLFFITAA